MGFAGAEAMSALVKASSRRRILVVVLLVAAAELAFAWLGTRPLLALLSSFALERGELFAPGSVMLLEVLRLGRQSLVPIAWITFEALALGIVLLLPTRALLLVSAVEPEALPEALGARSLWLVPRLALHHITLWIVYALGVVACLLALVPARDTLSEGELSWLWLLPGGALIAWAATLLQLFADLWALELAQKRGLFRAARAAWARCREPKWLGGRGLKSALVLGIGALGFVTTRETTESAAWFGWFAVRFLGFAAVALDWYWYRLLGKRMAPISAARPLPDDRAGRDVEPVGPTPDLDA